MAKNARRFQGATMVKAREIFCNGLQEKMPECGEALAALNAGTASPQAAERVYRFVHTLKGSGRMVGMTAVADAAAAMETALLLLREYDIPWGEGLRRFLNERWAEILAAVEQCPEESCATVASGFSKPNGKRILVVDDDPAITTFVRDYLEKNGFAVAVCHDTKTAEESLMAELPDLIVLDMVFPNGDGIEFCRALRSSEAWGMIPVIFLTVKDRLQDKLSGFSTGADDYICKPFKVEELLARIEAVLKRACTNEELILRDELTQAYNRRYLQSFLAAEIARAQRTGEPFSLAMVDLDHFKKINDSHGHLAGDETLQALVQTFLGNLRGTDVICRYGGEEFVIVMPRTPRGDGVKIMERLRQTIAGRPLQLRRSQVEIALTFSAGVAGFPSDGISGEELLRAADQALYRAKAAGRNRVMQAGGADEKAGAGPAR
ncbi:diguanylate cyclase (GGDEF)-like protein [Hydrogenispora ethanolica]|jgi:diguanylate cyclase (GGDEF)-like protein|uniref:Diguanylate cyclase (GGDEF)-like protein n=1 Tax=Hydrogenispora ethanolica TaxID=1082276 RepID=A0A4R1S1X0_HYDET|nr:diguanylate cyclase [Hydrogenispora ethanolica]TCL72302.1 diguanylate cyclase (GGDEF)-like protein [Hydrogenispora ethanolica]